MELVAFLGDDRGTWGQVNALINQGEWEKVIIVKNKTSEEFVPSREAKIISVSSDKPILELKREMLEKFKNEIGEMEVALSLASGNGKEHMALISALLSIPVGVRLAVFTKEGIQFIN